MAEINNLNPLNDAGSVIAVHLSNGQTVLGRAMATPPGSDIIRIKKPMALIVQQGQQQGQLAVSMMPYLTNGVFPVLEQFDFEQYQVIHLRPVPDRLEKMYIEMSSGIAIAPAGSRIATP
jgi:hypothetical protein